MSRTIIEQQMTATSNREMKLELECLLYQYPAKDGWEIQLDTKRTEGYWYVYISARDAGTGYCTLRYKLDNVPEIRQYLSDKGFLYVAWNKYKEKRATEEARAYEQLFNEPKLEEVSPLLTGVLRMSRTVIETEARTNPSKAVSDQLNFYLSQCSPADRYEVFLEVSNPEGPHFEAVIWAESPKAIRPRLRIPLENVSTIREYLYNKGALKIAYDEYKQEVLEDLRKAREVLMITEEETVVTQTIDVSIQRAKTS